MRKFRMVYMRGGTSKGCIFRKEDLPEDQKEWDAIFSKIMGNPDPKQIDGLGGTVSSNNKIVVVWKSELPGVDIEYLTVQSVVGRTTMDYKANCGNMTSAVGPFAIEEKMVEVVEPVTTVHLLNRNTDKYIDVAIPCKAGKLASDGDCQIDGIDGTAPEIRVAFLKPEGAKTGKLFPTGNLVETFAVHGYGDIQATVIDVSNPLVLVRAQDVGMKGTELPEEINARQDVLDLLEQIRSTAAIRLGFAKNAADAAENSPGAPKIAFFTGPQNFIDIAGRNISRESMDICVRVISVFKCHKATPITAAGAIGAACCLQGTILAGLLPEGKQLVRIGHPSGTINIAASVSHNAGEEHVENVALQRTARRIMDGTVYIRD
jgi:2-methylaconitate isomerase